MESQVIGNNNQIFKVDTGDKGKGNGGDGVNSLGHRQPVPGDRRLRQQGLGLRASTEPATPSTRTRPATRPTRPTARAASSCRADRACSRTRPSATSAASFGDGFKFLDRGLQPEEQRQRRNRKRPGEHRVPVQLHRRRKRQRRRRQVQGRQPWPAPCSAASKNLFLRLSSQAPSGAWLFSCSLFSPAVSTKHRYEGESHRTMSLRLCKCLGTRRIRRTPQPIDRRAAQGQGPRQILLPRFKQ